MNGELHIAYCLLPIVLYLNRNKKNTTSMTANELKKLEVWFVTGSQDLYGEETLKQVAKHSS
ncbi:MAG TPA: hypothetical protein VFH07_12100, partial [Chitinophagaceae bacterium]|nr:hypothetical protein [Chitinophagaceae bacterium]